MRNNREFNIHISKIHIKIIRHTQANGNYYFVSYRYNEEMDKWELISQHWDLEAAKKDAERIKGVEVIRSEVVAEYK